MRTNRTLRLCFVLLSYSYQRSSTTAMQIFLGYTIPVPMDSPRTAHSWIASTNSYGLSTMFIYFWMHWMKALGTIIEKTCYRPWPRSVGGPNHGFTSLSRAVMRLIPVMNCNLQILRIYRCETMMSAEISQYLSLAISETQEGFKSGRASIITLSKHLLSVRMAYEFFVSVLQTSID